LAILEIARHALGYEETARAQRELLASGGFPDEETRASVAAELETLLRSRGPTLFDTVLDILRDRGVTVELL
jgi:hypothetical protein